MSFEQNRAENGSILKTQREVKPKHLYKCTSGLAALLIVTTSQRGPEASWPGRAVQSNREHGDVKVALWREPLETALEW